MGSAPTPGGSCSCPLDPLQHSAIHPFTQAFGEPASTPAQACPPGQPAPTGHSHCLKRRPTAPAPPAATRAALGFSCLPPRLPGHLVPKQVLSIVTWPYSLVGPTPANGHTTSVPPHLRIYLLSLGRDVDQCIPQIGFVSFFFFFFLGFVSFVQFLLTDTSEKIIKI